MQIHGLNKTTLLDYPGRVAATVFTGGCNFLCPFCHNKDLVLNPFSQTAIPEEEVLAFLQKRKGIITGVCITGGEPTLQADLSSFLYQVKELGYLVKLDTNGYRPEIIERLVNHSLIDYVAMDIKTSPLKYGDLVNVKEFDISRIEESVSYLMSCGISYEFRTTVVKELHDMAVFLDIASWLKDAKLYYLQNFTDSEGVIKAGFHSYSKDELTAFLQLVKKEIPNTFLRGI